jgi:glycosidase
MGKRSWIGWGLGACVSLAAAAPPVPLVPGIHPLSDNEVLLCLTAPGKAKVNAVGDFNGWSGTANPMRKEGDLFWTTLGGLTPGKEYVFQYWVDDNIHVGDPYAGKIMDYQNDALIRSEGTYPDLPPYAREQDGPAAVFRAGMDDTKPPAPFARPAPENLLIYEVLIRDFVKSHSFKEMKDSLAYFKRLGVNALELMPVMEYEGNEGWGYNTIYFMAVDKYYGPAADLKAFIDAAHAQGLAIILDVVMNHAMGQSPLVRMYWDDGAKAPIANAPYANVSARHPYSVGFDLNYESPYTMAYMKDMLRYWLREFGVDGYRIDLSKGLTQKNTFGDVAAWNRMDPSRVRILDTLAAAAREGAKDPYLILEHFADNDEETLLSSHGFLLWGNEYWDFGGAMAGDVGKSFRWAYAKGGRGWKEDHLIAYMESHDEERLMANAAATGASSGAYDIKDFNTALERYKLAALFYLGVPGPKQLWQFGEYGDDRPRGPTANGQHMGKKPMPDAWRGEAPRLRLWGAWSSLLHFRGAHAAAFKDGAFSWKPDGAVRNWKIAQGGFAAYAVGNFGVNPDRATLPLSGTWYDFFSREKVSLDGSAEVPLKPGEFHLLLNQPEFAPEAGLTDFSLPASLDPVKVTVALRGTGTGPHPLLPARARGAVRLVTDARGLPRDVAGKARSAGAVR